MLCLTALNYIFNDSPILWQIRLCIGAILTDNKKKRYYEKSGTGK